LMRRKPTRTSPDLKLIPEEYGLNGFTYVISLFSSIL
jgi:hypothetical protein